MKHQLQSALIFIFAIISSFVSYSQLIPDDSLYLGQSPPGIVPKKFNLPCSTGFFVAEKIAISLDGKEIYYTELNGYPWSTSKIKQFKYSNNRWNGPFDLFQGYIAPVFSHGGNTLYFEDSQPNAWYSIRTDTSWSSPFRFWNSSHQQHNLQVVDTGKYFMTSDPLISANGDISELLIQNSDTTVHSLGVPLNSASNGMDFFIAKDESYIMRVVKSNGLGNLYISYHRADGSWTNPKNLGAQINASQAWEWGPYVTNDNKYLFFTRQISSIDIYWVRIGDLIDSLKHTNFIPYLKKNIVEQKAVLNTQFYFRIPESTFFDDDENDSLIYTATLNNGKPLPAWLSFDSSKQTFSGVPNTIGVLSIKVTGTDRAGANTSGTFTITTTLPTINYFGQTPPGDSAIIFIPGVVAQPNRPEHAALFSRDGKEFYFNVVTDNWMTRNMYVRKYIDSTWTTEELASFSSITGGAAEAFMDNRNTHIIFVSGDGTATSDGWLKTDFFITERMGNGWGTPKKLNAAIDDIEVQWHPSISDSGHIYFGSKGSVYWADQVNDTTYSSPVKLNDAGINKSGFANADPCIAANEKYLIFSSNRPGGYGDNDLYISYRNADNTWGGPVNLGPKINSSANDFSAYLTPDGKYLLFARDNGSTRHIYWVSSGFIDSIRHIITGVNQEKSSGPMGYE